MRPTFVMIATVALCWASFAQAQHHHVDPFAGSGCNCSTFCDGSCAINATGHNTYTLYRMTPHGVLDMNNKNTGDVKGDTSFILSRRTTAYECRVNPNQFQCNSMTQFDGDDSNSTDLIIEFEIEVDGNWGPYLRCNPVNVSDPEGDWDCTNSVTPGGQPKDWPAQCAAENFTAYDGNCISGHPSKSMADSTIAKCCDAAHAGNYHTFSFERDTLFCNLFRFGFRTEKCNGLTGFVSQEPTSCDCPRVHKTVGRENLTVAYQGMTSMHPAGGLWFSHPEEGECKDGASLGTNGCTWRVAKRLQIINASCMYEHIDSAVEAQDPSCFSACAQPKNVTSSCYLKCYSDATRKMTHDQLADPWTKAFASDDVTKGGCPKVSA